MKWLKTYIDDFLFLIFGGGDEDYQPGKEEYIFFGILMVGVIVLIMVKGLS